MHPVLTELNVENLLVIESAALRLHDGLNVWTGETGAGKTVLAKGLDLLLGCKTPKDVVRAGSDDAYVEGVFRLPDGWLAVNADLGLEDITENADEIVLARRVTSQGRSRCLIDGRTVSLDMLRSAAQRLIAFYGQHEQRRLMLDDVQRQLLDASGDGKGLTLLNAYQDRYKAAKAARRAFEQLQAEAASGRRELDFARFELQELDDLDMQAGEEAQLMAELKQLSEAADGQQAAAQAQALLSGDEENTSAVAAVSRVADLLAGFQSEDAVELARRLQTVSIELDDIARDVTSLAGRWHVDPARLDDVHRRMQRIHDLCRKHECDADDLPAVQEKLRKLLNDADDLPRRVAEARHHAEQELEAAAKAAGKLSAWRRKAAPKLAAQVQDTFDDLALDGAQFIVALDETPGDGLPALSDTGAERVTFMFRSGPGLPQGPLSKVASGGEVSRIMLALTATSANAADAPVLVLDEPDTGIGGHTAHGVADRLVSLAAARQVLVISHLPQIAARADRHFVLSKDVDAQVARTTIEVLSDEDAVIAELCRMGGHRGDDINARQAARALRAAA